VEEPEFSGQELPLACSLAPTELEDRKRLMREIGGESVESVDLADGQLTIRFADGPGLRDALEGLIALEAKCCPFLEFRIEQDAGTLTLAVEAPEGPESSLDAIRHMLASPVS
jgi:hypothetical protein